MRYLVSAASKNQWRYMMIYVGHFSFDELGEDGVVRHGYFTAIVDSENRDVAVDAFKEAVVKLRERGLRFRRCKAVYIEDIIKMPSVPKQAMITRYQSSAGAFPKSVSYSLPLADTLDVDSYGLARDIEKIQENSDRRYQEMTPFMTF